MKYIKKEILNFKNLKQKITNFILKKYISKKTINLQFIVFIIFTFTQVSLKLKLEVHFIKYKGYEDKLLFLHVWKIKKYQDFFEIKKSQLWFVNFYLRFLKIYLRFFLDFSTILVYLKWHQQNDLIDVIYLLSFQLWKKKCNIFW